jgi:hypothetical protein
MHSDRVRTVSRSDACVHYILSSSQTAHGMLLTSVASKKTLYPTMIFRQLSRVTVCDGRQVSLHRDVFAVRVHKRLSGNIRKVLAPHSNGRDPSVKIDD